MTDTPDCKRCPRCAKTETDPDSVEARTAAHTVATPFPMPVPLLMQLTRPLNTLDDIESLAAQLSSARARGCF